MLVQTPPPESRRTSHGERGYWRGVSYQPTEPDPALSCPPKPRYSPEPGRDPL